MSILSVLRKPKKPASPAPVDLSSSGYSDSELEKFTQAQKDALIERLEKDRLKNEHLRTDQRQSCFLIARLEFVEKGLGMDGVVTDASLGGINFRPASRFIQERTNERIVVHIGDVALKGILRRTQPSGYGIQINPRMTDEQFADILEASALPFEQTI
ncbi:hypothetical protein [Parvularcula marina]|uniref:PilZ domain-containing protein n=1 Tax=Parvularcula marina TaxID=2292771 RepID=A0A371RI41_9PROT|nr:hypothetical protein [Parvularcula marina]RFB05098.1 hypothetical protein DX908_07435 [Parvularcula marina]